MMSRLILLSGVVGLLSHAASAGAQRSLGGREPSSVLRAPHLKSPTRARVIGIFPGAGHMYAGETRRGFEFLGGTLAVLIVGQTVSDNTCPEPKWSDKYCSSPALDALTFVAAGGVLAWSIVDAGRAARRTNAKRIRFGSSVLKLTRIATARQQGHTVASMSLSIATR